jgi:hypothetical protein
VREVQICLIALLPARCYVTTMMGASYSCNSLEREIFVFCKLILPTLQLAYLRPPSVSPFLCAYICKVLGPHTLLSLSHVLISQTRVARLRFHFKFATLEVFGKSCVSSCKMQTAPLCFSLRLPLLSLVLLRKLSIAVPLSEKFHT